MKCKYSKIKTEARLKIWLAKSLLFAAILAVCGTLRANDLYFQYDILNGLVEADYPDGTRISYDDDAVGNRVSEAVGMVTIVNGDLTIQYKLLKTTPLLYSAEVSEDQINWSDNVNVSSVSFNNQYYLVTAADASGTDPVYIRLDSYPVDTDGSISTQYDTPLLPLWAAAILAAIFLGIGFHFIQNRGERLAA